MHSVHCTHSVPSARVPRQSTCGSHTLCVYVHVFVCVRACVCVCVCVRVRICVCACNLSASMLSLCACATSPHQHIIERGAQLVAAPRAASAKRGRGGDSQAEALPMELWLL